MKLLAATNNAHKLEEIRNILSPLGIQVLSGRDVGGVPDVEENGDSFEANAIIKAEASALHTGMPVIADDSGLEVFAINREPGIYSARYAGPDATDLDKINKVLGKLADKDDRSARFACVIALATPHGTIGTVEGEVRGAIADAPTGDGGFGYDPVFVPDGYTQSFAEIPGDEKNSISHRGNALQNLVKSGLLNQINIPTDLVADESLSDAPGADWTWLRESADNWRLADGLQIDVLPGTLWCHANDARNVLCRKAPATRGAVEVTVTNRPVNGGEQAGIVLMADEDNYVKLVKESLQDTKIVMAHEVDAEGKAPFIIDFAGADTVQLRLEYDLDEAVVTGYYREGIEDAWIKAGEIAPPAGSDLQVCLAAHGGDESPVRKALFQRFRLLA